MNSLHPEKIWQLSDANETLKSTFESITSSKFSKDSSLLIVCNGKAVIAFQTNNIFKQKPIYLFVLKAEDTLDLIKPIPISNSLESLKNLSFLKSTLKNIENGKKHKKNKNENFKSLISKFQNKRHILFLNDYLQLMHFENHKRDHIIFTGFQKAERDNEILLLIHTNLGEYLIYAYNLTNNTNRTIFLSYSDLGIKTGRILSCLFLKEPMTGLGILLTSQNDDEAIFVTLQLTTDLKFSNLKKIIFKMPPFKNLSMKLFSQSSILLMTDFDCFILNFDHKKNQNNKNVVLESDRLQNIGLSSVLFDLSCPFTFPIKVKVQNSVCYFLFAQQLFSFDSLQSHFFEICKNQTGHFVNFALKNEFLYIMDRSKLYVRKKDGSLILTFIFREFDFLSDFKISKNQFIFFVFGKKCELFSHKMDLAIFRNSSLIIKSVANCTTFEFLFYASNWFKISIKKCKNSKNNENLEVSNSPVFWLLENLSIETQLKLKLAYFWFSNSLLNFQRTKIELLLLKTEKPDFFQDLLDENFNFDCPQFACGLKVTDFNVKFLRTQCKNGHFGYFCANSGRPVEILSEQIKVCLKCELFFENLQNCWFCDLKLI